MILTFSISLSHITSGLSIQLRTVWFNLWIFLNCFELVLKFSSGFGQSSTTMDDFLIKKREKGWKRWIFAVTFLNDCIFSYVVVTMKIMKTIYLWLKLIADEWRGKFKRRVTRLQCDQLFWLNFYSVRWQWRNHTRFFIGKLVMLSTANLVLKCF